MVADLDLVCLAHMEGEASGSKASVIGARLPGGKKAYVLMVYTELQTVSARYCYDEAHTYQQQWLQTS